MSKTPFFYFFIPFAKKFRIGTEYYFYVNSYKRILYDCKGDHGRTAIKRQRQY
jgi:hypothetical protein